MLNKVDTTDSNIITTYQEIPFKTTKSFDNMFFEAKEELIGRLDYFMKNEDKYKDLGMPYTLGMLFHGPPGTSKTSCIKAIARYTNRHIISIPIKKINNIDVLKHIFLSPKINDVFIPSEKRLYVFEEIDCGQWANIVQNRSMSKSETDSIPIEFEPEVHGPAEYRDVRQTTKPTKQKQKDIKQPEPSITLGEFLELIDGIVEIPGRMMVMTSNHPDKLDPALIRPGRVDIVIEFKKMTRKDIAKMYQLWFSQEVPKHIYNEMLDYIFSQAEIGNLFSTQDKKLIMNALKTSTIPVDKKTSK